MDMGAHFTGPGAMRRTKLFVAAFLMSCGCAAGAAEEVLIRTPDGATLSAMLALPASKAAVPTVLIFDIYAKPDDYASEVRELADRGYAGVVADTRGKRLSPDAIEPYEHEAKDTGTVIDWIAKQPWSNGKVGMIGGSYSGFTAWAATKYRHRALKGIAVSAAAIPGQGLPMYNNVFLNANYVWPFYVTNNKLLDESLGGDRWWNLNRNWFISGRPYREIDAIDGVPNPWLQRWLKHPAYDRYWQDMVPYGRDFAHIDIPVLTITGYYDDGQISALKYFTEHITRRRGAEHYVVIGPYDHFGTHAREKPAVLREYSIDPAARFDSFELKLAFMDYVLRGRPRPAMLANRINYEVMGANQWRSVPSIAAMHPHTQRLYFSTARGDPMNALVSQPPLAGSFVRQEIDLADRQIFHDFHSYPNPIVQGPLQYITEAVYQSEPFEQATTVSGAFSGEVNVTINKRDFDFGVVAYEQMPDGKLFHLGYALQRASYAADPTTRHLLTPGKAIKIPFATTWVSRQMQPGSRLLVLLDGVKNQYAQVNYGTGKDVSDESVKDAGEPLAIRWNAGSYVDVPID
jgi:putative CocE/NonD family hydrolase